MPIKFDPETLAAYEKLTPEQKKDVDKLANANPKTQIYAAAMSAILLAHKSDISLDNFYDIVKASLDIFWCGATVETGKMFKDEEDIAGVKLSIAIMLIESAHYGRTTAGQLRNMLELCKAPKETK